MAFLRHDFSCFFSFLQNSARRSAAYPLRGYCYFSKFLWPFHRLPPMHTEDVLSELPVLFLSKRYSPPSPKPCRLFLSNFPLYRFLSMVIIFVLNSWFSDRNHDSGPAEIRISEHFVFFPALAGLKMLICWRGAWFSGHRGKYSISYVQARRYTALPPALRNRSPEVKSPFHSILFSRGLTVCGVSYLI